MSSTEHLSETRLDSLGLHPLLVQAVHELGFERCTPIQAATLPLLLKGENVAGQAQTGTGKTAAFLLATFQHLLTHPAAKDRDPRNPRMICLAPTRELAVQIHKDAESLGKYAGFRLGLVYGGAGYEAQREMLRQGVDLLIGTPGRLIDYYQQKIFDLRAVQVAILDEADRMFDLGFIKDIRYLLRRMPPPEKRLNMMFSATLSYRVLELAYEHMNDPRLIKAGATSVTADKVREALYHVSMEDKIPLMLGLLRQIDPTRSLIFVNTKRAAETVEAYLNANGLQSATLSGDVPQPKRLRLLKEFQEGKLPILVATDVAARGLHIPEVSHVFNYDLPQDPEDYVHRVGRTARAGAEGDAISLCCETYVYSLPDIEKFVGRRLPVTHADPSLFAHDLKRPTHIERHRPPGHHRGQQARGRPGGGHRRSGRR
jgi:ATP-dependent RNA helicase RhlB